MSILLDDRTRVLVVGASGRQAQRHVPFMLDYGTRVVAGVAPADRRVDVPYPVHHSIGQAAQGVGGADLAVLFIPAARCLAAVTEAAAHDIATIVVLAEGVPFRDTVEMVRIARERNVRLIGPNCQGIISPGQAKVGASGGRTPARMFRPGRVGVVSRSGGMGAETCWLLTRSGLGQSTYVSIGGEGITGTRFLDVARLFENDPETDAIVCFGEPGTDQEEELAQAIRRGDVTKPLVAYVTGEFVERLGAGRSFGHAGSTIQAATGAPSEKKRRLHEAGAIVADRWTDIPVLVRAALERSGGGPVVGNGGGP